MSFVLFAFGISAGQAIILVCCLAALGIVGFFFVCYFAHCFMLVVIDSASGIDEIRWPSEGISEWITKPIYVLWVMLPLLVIASIVLMATHEGLAFWITLLGLAWLVAPIMYLSTLAAKSWIALFYGPFINRWARYLFAYILFLLWSAPLVGLGGALLMWSMRDLRGVALSAFFVPAIFLLYWRVLGRYAWYVTTRRMRKAKKKKVNPTKGLKIDTLDPWAAPDDDTQTLASRNEHDEAITEQTDARGKFVPEDQRDKVIAAELHDQLTQAEEPTVVEDEWTPNKKPYVVMTESQAKESWVERRGTAADDAEGYDVDDLSIGPPVSLWKYYMEREQKEEELRAQGKSVRQYIRPRKPPTLWEAMTQEIIGFVFYGHSLRAQMALGILFGIVLAILNLIVQISGQLGAA